jgi:hypothetical protein
MGDIMKRLIRAAAVPLLARVLAAAGGARTVTASESW